MSARPITFTVHGIPAPQGSKNAWGQEDNPRTRPWRAAVTDKAGEFMAGAPALACPVLVVAEFYFPRPKGHYRTGRNAHLLRDSAPAFHTSHPDLDKLQRAIGDSLSGVVVRDDKQIAAWDVRKLWAESGRAVVRVEALDAVAILSPPGRPDIVDEAA